ncbi:GntR family transcriptional regulator [Eubacteriales bacterium OttesenSCG-928-G02]|nr:GntR family transcriptional regulator [Eubacteriales bacterium OttesenSCG-928-G02]
MFNIDYNRRKPINEQLIDQVITYVMTGVLKAGEWLPSVRQLSTDLSINVNTIQKAYSELERRNIIITVKGKGSFITEDLKILEDYMANNVISNLKTVVSDAKLASWSLEKLNQETNNLWNEGTKND